MKGLAITGVVAGHAFADTLVEVFVNYWHLPIFFFVSGYFLKEKHLDNWKGFVKSRFTRLIIPFLLFAIGALLLHNSLYYLNIINGVPYVISDYISQLKHLLILSSNEVLIGAMWFLPALFIVSLCGFFAIKTSQKNRIASYLVFIMLIISTAFCYFNIPSPYSIWQNLSISWIFILGYYSAKKSLDNIIIQWYWFVLSSFVLVLMLCLDMRFGLQASMINQQSLLFPIVFISGIIMINYISHKITNTRIGNLFAIVGDFSFSIMALHFLGFKLVTFLRSLINNDINLSDFPVVKTDLFLWAPFYILIGISFPILTTVAYNKVRNAWYSYRRIQES